MKTQIKTESLLSKVRSEVNLSQRMNLFDKVVILLTREQLILQAAINDPVYLLNLPIRRFWGIPKLSSLSLLCLFPFPDSADKVIQ